jgi:hypothetical protein
MKSLSHIKPTGKLVRFDNINIVADVTPCLETFNIEALYRLNGTQIAWGDRATESGELYNEKFRETLYNELDHKKFFLVFDDKSKKKEAIAKQNAMEHP